MEMEERKPGARGRRERHLERGVGLSCPQIPEPLTPGSPSLVGSGPCSLFQGRLLPPPGRALSQHGIWENPKSQSSSLCGCETPLSSPASSANCLLHFPVAVTARTGGSPLPGYRGHRSPGGFLPTPPSPRHQKLLRQGTGALCCLLGDPQGPSQPRLGRAQVVPMSTSRGPERWSRDP